jgi:hypothetical protein
VFLVIFLTASRIAAPSVLSKAPYPNNIIGVYAFLSLAKNGCDPSAIS